MKKREAKSQAEKESYTHLNAEFQRIAKRDKKAFLRDQCKEIKENNRMGKTRDLFKKIRDTKGIFHAKMGSIKEKNARDLREAEDIKKRWQIHFDIWKNQYNIGKLNKITLKKKRRGGKNTQKNCPKKIFMTQIIMMV